MADQLNDDGGFRPMNVHGGENTSDAERVDPFINKYRAFARRLRKLIGEFCLILKQILWSMPNSNVDGFHDLTPESTFWEHCEGLSNLSRVFSGLLLVTVVIMLMTLESVWFVLSLSLQTLGTLYFVYWRHHRLDLSLNAVVQYFSMGFVLAFYFLASVYLLAVVALLYCFFQNNCSFPSWIEDLLHPQFFLYCAIILGGGLKEYLKYRGFAMSQARQQPHIIEDQHDSEALLVTNAGKASDISFISSGAAITCAMVSVATGFAWLEIYVFVLLTDVNFPPWSILAVRNCLHPLLAAIQSIGVCARDLEQNLDLSLLTILAPAVVLHGLYDCFLIQSSFDETPDPIKALAGCGLTVILAVTYYVYFARQQQLRLQSIQEQYVTGQSDGTSCENGEDADEVTDEVADDTDEIGDEGKGSDLQ